MADKCYSLVKIVYQLLWTEMGFGESATVVSGGLSANRS